MTAGPSKLRFLILQHPQEARNPLSTVPLVAPVLPGTVHRVGLSWRSLAKALGEPAADPKQWGVLFLGALKDMPKLADVPLQIVAKAGATKPALSSLRGIVVLDGNWKQSKTLWWRNAWLLRLHRLVLRPETASQYTPLRKQPRRECLSTIEAIASCLDALSPGKPDGARLRDSFAKHLAMPRELPRLDAPAH